MGNALIWILVGAAIVYLFFPTQFEDMTGINLRPDSKEPDETPIVTNQTTQDDISTSEIDLEFSGVSVVNWNLQIFGVTKAADEEKMAFYADFLEEFDIAFVQEIRDSSGVAFDMLCDMIPTHKCDISSRAGRTVSKEQYGIIYRENLELIEITDFNPDPDDRWERPPIAAMFNINDEEITFYNIHTKPDEAAVEILYLDELIGNPSTPTVVLGDLNADCNYYHNTGYDFANWTWVIGEDADTTVGLTNCAYDRIIVNPALDEYVFDSGISRQGITDELSDHYPVWIDLVY